MPIIALLTDFADRDVYAGVLKGVILRICPQAAIVDVTHHVSPFDIREGALLLWGSFRYFPSGTVFCCVVDPGVGSARRPLAARALDWTFVGPDNGLLWWALAEAGPSQVVEVRNKAYCLPVVSRTFHGRDIFAPVAAHLANGVPLDELGPEIPLESLTSLPPLHALIGSDRIVAEVIHIDRFGNAITNLREEDFEEWLESLGWRSWEARIAGETFSSIASHYVEVPKGTPLLVFNSYGLLEVAVREGSAERTLGIRKGDRLDLRATGRP